eukprot:846529-Pleurochrysis_carterae.AAC.1
MRGLHALRRGRQTGMRCCRWQDENGGREESSRGQRRGEAKAAAARATERGGHAPNALHGSMGMGMRGTPAPNCPC